jgi:hypothetical protein
MLRTRFVELGEMLTAAFIKKLYVSGLSVLKETRQNTRENSHPGHGLNDLPHAIDLSQHKRSSHRKKNRLEPHKRVQSLVV